MALSGFALLLINAAIATMMADRIVGRSLHGAVALKIYGIGLGVATLFALAYASFGIIGLLSCSLATGAIMERQ